MFDLCEATEDNPFIHGMSKPFVKALQELFDVMDTDNSGTIRYTDLASQWHEDVGDPFFPKGLIACLAKVTLPNGLLTFDRFCAGIKLCLLKNQVEINEEAVMTGGFCPIGPPDSLFNGPTLSEQGRPSSEPQIFAPPPPSSLSSQQHVPNQVNNDVYCHKNTMESTSSYTTSTDDLTKSKKLPLPSYEQVMAAKSKSLSKLSVDRTAAGNDELSESVNSAHSTSNQQARPNTFQTKLSKPFEDRPKLYENCINITSESSLRQAMSEQCQRAKSMSNLEALSTSHWLPMTNGTSQETKLLISPGESKSPKRPITEGGQSVSLHNSPSSAGRSSTQPKTVSRNSIMKTLQTWRDNILHKQASDCEETRICETGSIVTNKGGTSSDLVSTASNSLRRNVPKRREPRRHTVGANGIDLYAIKRFQQLEQEKEIMIRGLGEIEKTKEWFIRHISSVQDKINFAGRCGSFPIDCNIDACQERINFQAARIQTVNQHLMALREAAHNFPIHMNLAIRPLNSTAKMDPNQPKHLVVNPNLVNKLKEQNRLLTEEVTRKCERITQLEREKSSLIRELFQARTYSSYYNGNFDDTMM